MRAILSLILAACSPQSERPVDFASRFVPVEAGDWSVCRSSQLAPDARLGAVGIILGREEFFRLGDDRDCQITFRLRPADLSLPAQVELASCTLAYGTRDDVVDQIELAPSSNDPVDLQKCLFRVGLWIIGSAEALSASDAELFLPIADSRWSGMGPMMPEIVPFNR